MRYINNLEELKGNFDAILCDAWGVIHNGVLAHKPAVCALAKMHTRGIPVIILTNAPRTQIQLRIHFEAMGVDPSIYDEIISSGEVGRNILLMSDARRCYHIGPEIDKELFRQTDIKLVTDPSYAEIIFNSGLRDNAREQSSHYIRELNELLDYKLPMICVNPDKHVHIGNDKRDCAGKLAELYQNMGGFVEWVGKPYPHIYEAAMRKLCDYADSKIDYSGILVIGDSIQTDIRGAAYVGSKSVLVLSGIHRHDLLITDDPAETLDSVRELCTDKSDLPEYVMNYVC